MGRRHRFAHARLKSSEESRIRRRRGRMTVFRFDTRRYTTDIDTSADVAEGTTYTGDPRNTHTAGGAPSTGYSASHSDTILHGLFNVFLVFGVIVFVGIVRVFVHVKGRRRTVTAFQVLLLSFVSNVRRVGAFLVNSQMRRRFRGHRLTVLIDVDKGRGFILKGIADVAVVIARASGVVEVVEVVHSVVSFEWG